MIIGIVHVAPPAGSRPGSQRAQLFVHGGRSRWLGALVEEGRDVAEIIEELARLGAQLLIHTAQRHYYYQVHTNLNPSNIVPAGPESSGSPRS